MRMSEFIYSVNASFIYILHPMHVDTVSVKLTHSDEKLIGMELWNRT